MATIIHQRLIEIAHINWGLARNRFGHKKAAAWRISALHIGSLEVYNHRRPRANGNQTV